ncbi:MAG TPA: cupredoxin domain-containing protein [Acidimicrobiales bacterium]
MGARVAIVLVLMIATGGLAGCGGDGDGAAGNDVASGVASGEYDVGSTTSSSTPGAEESSGDAYAPPTTTGRSSAAGGAAGATTGATTTTAGRPPATATRPAPGGGGAAPQTTAAPSSPPSTQAPATTTTAAPAPPAGPQAAITIQGFRFDPAVLNVAKGTRVTATNKDDAPHTWTGDGGRWDSGTLPKGASYSFVLADSGTFTYRCNIHASMTGSVQVS